MDTWYVLTNRLVVARVVHESGMALVNLVIPEIYQNLGLLTVAHNDPKGVMSCVLQFCKLWATLV